MGSSRNLAIALLVVLAMSTLEFEVKGGPATAATPDCGCESCIIASLTICAQGGGRGDSAEEEYSMSWSAELQEEGQQLHAMINTVRMPANEKKK